MTIYTLNLSSNTTTGSYTAINNSSPFSLLVGSSTAVAQTVATNYVSLSAGNTAINLFRVGNLITGTYIPANTYITYTAGANIGLSNTTTDIVPVNTVLRTYSNDYSNISYNINWGDIFKNKSGDAQLMFNLISNSSLNYFNDVGTISINDISMPYSNNQIIGFVRPNYDPTGPTNTSTTYQKAYITGSTIEGKGVSVKIPSGFQTLNVKFIDVLGVSLGLSEHYNLSLVFSTDKE